LYLHAMTVLTLAIPLIKERQQTMPLQDDPVDLQEFTLVSRARNGDIQAFEALYRRFVPRVFGLCRRMLGDPALAEELTQEVFVRVWEKLPLFRGRKPFAPWLLTVASRVVISHRRASSRRDRRIRAVEDLALVEPHATDFDSEPSRNADAGIDLETALSQLPDGARKVFVLHDVEGYKHQEIARMTGLAVGTSKAQLHRARRILRKVLST
jgi:RNA polymerase sigma-70 factor (ECF subfamily)